MSALATLEHDSRSHDRRLRQLAKSSSDADKLLETCRAELSQIKAEVRSHLPAENESPVLRRAMAGYIVARSFQLHFCPVHTLAIAGVSFAHGE